MASGVEALVSIGHFDRDAHVGNASIFIVACGEYESLRQQLADAMIEEDRARMDHRVTSQTAHHTRLEGTRSAVHMVEIRSKWHVQECEQCKADGNKPLEAGGL